MSRITPSNIFGVVILLIAFVQLRLCSGVRVLRKIDRGHSKRIRKNLHSVPAAVPFNIQEGVKYTARPANVFPQRFYWCSDDEPIASQSFMNCMGVLVASNTHSIGCLGHIEASSSDVYETISQDLINAMISDISNIYDLTSADTQIILFGNGNGNAALSALVASGGMPGTVTDRRGIRPAGGRIMAALYDPATNSFHTQLTGLDMPYETSDGATPPHMMPTMKSVPGQEA